MAQESLRRNGQRGLGFAANFTRRMDAGGARERSHDHMIRERNAQTTREEAYDRIKQAAGRIPVLKTIDEVVKHARIYEDVLMKRARIPFPALQIAKSLDMREVFASLPESYGHKPNLIARRTGQPSVGAHFDNYGLSGDYCPWTIHENIKGTGTIRAMFLPNRLLDAYNGMANALPETDEADAILAATRSSLGELAFSNANSHDIFVGSIKAGTHTLLWHGMSFGFGDIPPAVHEITRAKPGEYNIYADMHNGEPGAGFDFIEESAF